MNINAILSGISAWPVKPTGGGSAPGLAPPTGAAANAAPERDTFEQGQWWKNRAAAKVEATGAAACSCGACSSCGVKAYASVAQSLEKAAQSAGAAPITPADHHAVAPAAGTQGAESRNAGAELVGDRATYGPPPAGQPRPATGLGPINAAGSEDELERGTESGEVTRAAGQAVVQELSREEKLEVARLQQRDMEVKAHEMAHLAVAGPYARGGANFTYTTGPDGKKYAVGGEVSIDTSKEPSPEATIRKMRVIRAAAMAPADPSPQDRKVAAQADATMTEARRELEMIRLEEQREASRRELDMRMLGAGRTEGDDDTESAATATEGPGYTSPFGPASPVAARRATAALAAFDQAAAQLHIRA